MIRISLPIASLVLGLLGCTVGHQDFVSYRDNEIGKTAFFKEPFKFKNSGQLTKGKFVIAGQGFTHITKDKNGNLIHHFSVQEILPGYHIKEWVGKCLIYKVVDPKTYVIKSWGFDEGGNPLSCRTWP